jgi:competence protein ComEC
VGAVFIGAYVYIVGASPSLERAAIMYAAGSLAILFALPCPPARSLALAFIVQLAAKPASGDSVSFVLSYLALAGILSAGEWAAALARGRIPALIASPLSASAGAFLATFAYTAVCFGEVRPVGIVCGLVMVPLTTVFMVLSMIYLAAVFLLPFLCHPLAFALDKLYWLLDTIVSFASKAPFVSVPPESAPQLAAVALNMAAVAGLYAAYRVVEGRRREFRVYPTLTLSQNVT